MIKYVFWLRGIHRPTYLDIGANHPFQFSNTAIFYLAGCRGVNIEPNPLLIASFQSARPEDINLNVGVGAKPGTLDFYSMEDTTLSTFSESEYENLCRQGHKLAMVSKVDVLPISEVITEHCGGTFPDFLTIDIEGMEQEVLADIDFDKYGGPKVICLETAEYSSDGAGPKRKELMAFIESKAYLLYADTNLNSIYVKRSFWKPS